MKLLTEKMAAVYELWNKLEQRTGQYLRNPKHKDRTFSWTSSAKPRGLIGSRKLWSWCGHTR